MNYYESTTDGITFSKDSGDWGVYYYGYDSINEYEIEGYEEISEEDLYMHGIHSNDDLKEYFERIAENIADRINNGEFS